MRNILKNKLLQSSILTLLAALGSQAGTTYYVDPTSGNDWNTLSVMTSPLRSVDALNSRIYYPGDKILLKAGTTLSGELNITTSDAEGDPIEVSSYGTGTPAVVSSISLSGAVNVVVSGLSISNLGTLVKISGGHNNTVTHCTLSNAGTYGAYVSNSPYFTFSDNTYADTGTHVHRGKTVDIVSSSGSKVFGNKITINTYSNGVANIYIVDSDNTEVYSNTVSGGSQGVGVKGINRSVTNNKVYSNTISGIDGRAGDGEAIEFTGTNGYSASGSVFRNFIQGNTLTVNAIAAFHSPNVATYNNVILGPLTNTAIHYSSYSSGGSAYGNTIYNVPVAFSVSSGSGLTIKNNIVSHTKTAISTDNSRTTSEGYNNFYSAGSVGGTHLGQSTTSSPGFVSSTPKGPCDVRLVSGSPNIHSGSSLTTTYKYANSPKCTAWPCATWDQTSTGWDRGAFGF